MDRQVLLIAIWVVISLILLVSGALIWILIDSRSAHRRQRRKSVKRNQRKKESRDLPWWAYLIILIIILALIASVLGIFLLARAVWLFLAAHIWIVWVAFAGIGLWAAVRSCSDEDAPTWVQIVGILFITAVVLAVLFGAYLVIKAVVEWVGNAIAAVSIWLRAVKANASALWNSPGFGGFLWLLLIAGFLAWVGDKFSSSSSSDSSSSNGWGDYDSGNDDRKGDEDGGPEHGRGEYHLGWLGTPGYYYDYRDDPDDPDYDPEPPDSWVSGLFGLR